MNHASTGIGTKRGAGLRRQPPSDGFAGGRGIRRWGGRRRWRWGTVAEVERDGKDTARADADRSIHVRVRKA